MKFEYDAAVIKANGMEIQCPHQCFIGGEFVDSTDGKTYQTINPTTEEVAAHWRHRAGSLLVKEWSTTVLIMYCTIMNL